MCSNFHTCSNFMSTVRYWPPCIKRPRRASKSLGLSLPWSTLRIINWLSSMISSTAILWNTSAYNRPLWISMQLLSAGNMHVILICYSDIQTGDSRKKVIDGPIKFLLFVEDDTRDYKKSRRGLKFVNNTEKMLPKLTLERCDFLAWPPIY